MALSKIDYYHRQRGDDVVWDMPMMRDWADKIYVSCVFDWNKDKCKEWEGIAEIGGTGYDIKKVLPPEIEEVRPKINVGFTSRGCIRNCRFCLTPDSLVITNNGPIPISKIKIGEKVLTHTGRYKKVLDVLTREYEGKVISLDNGAVSRLFKTKITPEHPIFTRHVSYRSGGQRLTSFNWLEANKLNKTNTHRSREAMPFPRIKEERMPKKCSFKITRELMALIGWYLSEGYVSFSEKRGFYQTTFCLGKSEKELSYAKEIVVLAEKIGLKARIYHLSIGYRVVICKVKFSRWLIKNFGKLAHGKIIPHWVKILPKSFLIPMVETWVKGDGWESPRGETKVTTVSVNLAVSLHEIVVKLGYFSNINKHCNSNKFQDRIVNSRPAYTVIFRRLLDRKRTIKEDENYIYRTLKGYTQEQYSGLVYNLEVEDDNSYCSPSLTVHNCVVPQKEGKSRATGDIYDFWDGESEKITVLDNNILALKKHFEKIAGQIKKEKLIVDFNAGMDIRVATEEQLDLLKGLKPYNGYYKWAWDGDEDLTKKFEWLQSKLGKQLVYIIVGFLPFERIREKVETLKAMKMVPYIMRHISVYHDPLYVNFAQWVNQPRQLFTTTFEEFQERQKARKEVDLQTLNLFGGEK